MIYDVCNKMEKAMPKTNIKVQLTGQDGNAFAIMGKVTKALRSNGHKKSC